MFIFYWLLVLASVGRHKAGPYTFSANRLLLSDIPTTDHILPLLSSVLCLPSSIFRPLGRRPTDTRQGVS